jgi:3-dehydroquinate synthase
VELGERRYSIEIESGWLDRAGAALVARGLTGRAFVITDANVAPLALDRLTASLASAGLATDSLTLPPGEETKSLRHASRCYDRLVGLAADRRTLIVALGGGVIGDLAGFVAATYARGLAFVQIPTTLLAMVDSSVGGKVAVDHPLAKNIIGAFHQPSHVGIDPKFLESLPTSEYRAGLAEVVKYGVILDAGFFEFLETNERAIAAREPSILIEVVARCCRLKADVVEKDERETNGLRAALNYGHTFGHAFETAGGYSLLRHGEAVAIGMSCAARLAVSLGRIDDALARRQDGLLERLGLPTRIPAELAGREFVELMRRDKKSVGGKLRFVLPSRLGHVELVDGVPESLAAEVIEERRA